LSLRRYIHATKLARIFVGGIVIGAVSGSWPAADGWPLVGKPSVTGHPTRPTQPFILSRSINK